MILREKTIERPKEAITKVKTGKLDMKDVFIIFVGLRLFNKSFVAIIEIGYVIAYPISMYLYYLQVMFLPKKYSSGHSIILKDKTTYIQSFLQRSKNMKFDAIEQRKQQEQKAKKSPQRISSIDKSLSCCRN